MTLTHPSPHHNARPAGATIRVIVLHADAGASDAGTLSWLAAPESKVSYHTLIGRLGGVYTIVAPDRRAWHAGKGAWGGSTDVNSISLGLSFANRHDGTEALTPVQRAVAASVVRMWTMAYPSIEAVVTHAMVAPTRKTDPEHAPGFDLAEYVAAFTAARATP